MSRHVGKRMYAANTKVRQQNKMEKGVVVRRALTPILTAPSSFTPTGNTPTLAPTLNPHPDPPP